jgi:hypothetical protein
VGFGGQREREREREREKERDRERDSPPTPLFLFFSFSLFLFLSILHLRNKITEQSKTEHNRINQIFPKIITFLFFKRISIRFFITLLLFIFGNYLPINAVAIITTKIITPILHKSCLGLV